MVVPRKDKEKKGLKKKRKMRRGIYRSNQIKILEKKREA